MSRLFKQILPWLETCFDFFIFLHWFIYTKSAELLCDVFGFPFLGLAVLIALVRKYPPVIPNDG